MNHALALPSSTLVWMAWAASACLVFGQSSGPEGSYRLQPGDELEIQVIDIPDLAAVRTIQPDGMLSLVLLNEVPAAGLTVAELRHALTEGYAQFYRNPRLGVAVKSFGNLNVYVAGDVSRPGVIPLASGLTAVQAVIQAGGLLKTARAEKTVVLRDRDSGSPVVIPLHVTQVLEQGGEDVVLQRGDIIYVPQSDIQVYVGGEVARPGLIFVQGELTALAAVLQAGGFTSDASPKSAVLFRDSGRNSAVVKELHLNEVLDGSVDVTLQPYDIVYVPKSGIAKVNQAVDQYVRRLIPATLTLGFTYLLGGAAIIP